ncbi:protein of unknown function [Pseudomonas flavescens]|uniref:DUF4261 domain-containing protein n=1 Tax=Phytopseudomonas flavescens TaxID=29435 RepID=A0A1G7ZEV7_9GAMM|nr:DUF4261 domain-containing protein [Pseudomonas flavescens]SDH07169.1 protein of unknown function [Pseudomonas flavescens]
MSLFSRFFGRHDGGNADVGELVAKPGIENPLSLQVLFAQPLAITEAQLSAALRRYHPSMSGARCDISGDVEQFFALAGWGPHVVKMVGFDQPFPADAVEACVAPAHYPQQVKDQVRQQASHILLYYAGHETDPLEQYVALAGVAGALSGFGALAVLNETAHTSLPAAMFADDDMGEHSLEILRDLPLTMLYCGFVKYQVEGVQGVWMRTYGSDAFGQPDFAALAAGHHEGERYMDIFNNVLGYLIQSGAQMEAGHTMQVGETEFMRLREPAEAEYYLHGPERVLVAEIIAASEIVSQ